MSMWIPSAPFDTAGRILRFLARRGLKAARLGDPA